MKSVRDGARGDRSAGPVGMAHRGVILRKERPHPGGAAQVQTRQLGPGTTPAGVSVMNPVIRRPADVLCGMFPATALPPTVPGWRS
jgi:hypothetical protein